MHHKNALRTSSIACAVASVIAIGGCASQSSGSRSATAAAGPSQQTTMVKGADGKDVGEYVGAKPAAASKFAKLKFGMSPQDVMNTIGAPSNTTTHETGKRWIPFYFGPDARRLELLYSGEGCLTFTGGNIYGSGSNELIVIENDPKGACFES